MAGRPLAGKPGKGKAKKQYGKPLAGAPTGGGSGKKRGEMVSQKPKKPPRFTIQPITRPKPMKKSGR